MNANGASNYISSSGVCQERKKEILKITEIQVTGRKRRLQTQKVEKLAESIREIGLINPITVAKNGGGYVLISGLHRLEACKLLGWQTIPAIVIELDTLKRELAEIDENFIRAELTALERAEHLKRRKEIYEQLYPEVRRPHGGRPPKNCAMVTQFFEDVISKTGLSKRTIMEDIQIAERLTEKVKELIRGTALEDNRKELLKLSRLSEEEQLALAKKIKEGAKNLKEAKRKLLREAKASSEQDINLENCRLICGDVALLSEYVEPNSIDVIITDPPYSKNYLELYEVLSEEAAKVLKEGGSLLVMVGQSYLPQVISRLSKHLTYHWTLAYLTPGGQSVQLWQKNVNTFWKPILWFVKGKYTGHWVGDVLQSKPNDNDKRFHDWGQSESGIAEIIERFTFPGQTILDPFLGGGTTAVVALRMGRKFIGLDIDENAIEITKRRLILEFQRQKS